MSSSLTPAWRHQKGFVKLGATVVAIEHIVSADFGRINELLVTVNLSNGEQHVATHIDAMELAMSLKPSVLESRRLRWPKWAWLVHNFIGHPFMQVLALLRLYRAAFWVHDATVPRPTGAKEIKSH